MACRISLSGELASCGMEGSENGCPMHGQKLDKHCCDDSLTVYSIDNTCINTFYSPPEEPRTNQLSLIPVQGTTVHNKGIPAGSNFTDTGPPLLRDPAAVNLPSICLFRL